MKTAAAWIFALTALIAFSAHAEDNAKQGPPPLASTVLTDSDRSFLVEAAQGGLVEVQLGRLIQVTSPDPAFKHFGRRLEDDHARLNQELQTLAKRHGLN